MERVLARIPVELATVRTLPLSERDATLRLSRGTPLRERAPRFRDHPTGRGTSSAGGARDRSAIPLSESGRNLHARSWRRVGPAARRRPRPRARSRSPPRPRGRAAALRTRDGDPARPLGARTPAEGTRPIGLLVLDGLLLREATVGDHPRPSCSARVTWCARGTTRSRRSSSRARSTGPRSRDPRRGDRPRARRPRRAVAGGLRRRCSTARRGAPSGSSCCRRSRTSRASTTACSRCLVPGRALGPGRAGRRGRLAAALAPHARRHGRRPPPVGHHRARAAHGPRRDRAPRGRRMDPDAATPPQPREERPASGSGAPVRFERTVRHLITDAPHGAPNMDGGGSGPG